MDGQCVAGVCPIPCPVGYTCCIDGCVDTWSNLRNCRGCGIACDTRTANSCQSGNCSCHGASACPPDDMCCPISGCRHVLTDPSNCGGCDIACGERGPDCFDGHCACGMRMPCYWNDDAIACMDHVFEEFQLCCDGACVQVGDGNCGECGLACGPGTHCGSMYMGTCQFSCMTDP